VNELNHGDIERANTLCQIIQKGIKRILSSFDLENDA
jgi:hypothetical protein